MSSVLAWGEKSLSLLTGCCFRRDPANNFSRATHQEMLSLGVSGSRVTIVYVIAGHALRFLCDYAKLCLGVGARTSEEQLGWLARHVEDTFSMCEPKSARVQESERTSPSEYRTHVLLD